jgi:hypothetical protein
MIKRLGPKTKKHTFLAQLPVFVQLTTSTAAHLAPHRCLPERQRAQLLTLLYVDVHLISKPILTRLQMCYDSKWAECAFKIKLSRTFIATAHLARRACSIDLQTHQNT